MNILINKNNVVWYDAFVVVKMPHHSDYYGYTCCISNKLVRLHGGMVSVYVKDNFTFRIKKKGNGKYNRFTTIDEKVITAADFADAFGVSIDEEPGIHMPDELHAEKREALEELKDAD